MVDCLVFWICSDLLSILVLLLCLIFAGSFGVACGLCVLVLVLRFTVVRFVLLLGCGLVVDAGFLGLL